MPGPLRNTRHEAFAQALARGLSYVDAQREAGYTVNRGHASRMAAREDVRERVAELTAPAAKEAQIDIARTLAELARIGFSDVRRLVDANGNLKRIEDLDDDTAAAVAAIEVVARTAGRNDDGETEIEYVHKIKLWDKNTALDKIAKHLGMMVDRVRHEGEVNVTHRAVVLPEKRVAEISVRPLDQSEVRH